MIYNVKARPRNAMNRILKTGSNNLVNGLWSLISIYSGDKESLEFLTPKTINQLSSIGMIDYLSLNFGDITDKDYDVISQYPQYKPILFSDEHSQKIVSFVKKNHELETSICLLIHCDAGISRSGAIAEFVQGYCDIDYNLFKKENPNIMPNVFIKNKLMRRLYD